MPSAAKTGAIVGVIVAICALAFGVWLFHRFGPALGPVSRIGGPIAALVIFAIAVAAYLRSRKPRS
jgi:Mg/Co/Ni transporter MgtE